MKKILSLMLFIALLCTMLISCEKEKIGDYLGEYEQSKKPEVKLTLNMYIIVGEGSSDNALQSVARQLDEHTVTKYNTNLKLYYVEEDDYAETVTAAINKNDENSPDLLLINSPELLNSLAPLLADLTKYVDGETFGRLNTTIPKALLQGSKITVGSETKLLTIPNNHLIGEYKYLMIDKAVAEHYLFSTTDTSPLNSCKTLEDDYIVKLKAAMKADGKSDDDFNKAVFFQNGPYEMKAEYEARGYICNVSEAPVVTPEEAFSSAFAVVSNIDTMYHDRAMQIIYEINTDKTFRNLLQYGIENTNYEIKDGSVVRKTEDKYCYNMNLLYTGDIFNAYYCEELGWTEDIRENVFNQNEDSVLPAKFPAK